MKERLAASTTTSPLYSRWSFLLLGILAVGSFVFLIWIGAAPFLYCARVPLLTLALFGVALPFLATQNFRSLLLGAYDLNGFQGGQPDSRRDFGAGMAFGLVLVFCGMTIYTTETVAMELGPVRLDNMPFFSIPLWMKYILGCLVWAGILVNVRVTWIASTSRLSQPRETPDGGDPRRGSRSAKPALQGLVAGVILGALIWISIEAVIKIFHVGLGSSAAANGLLSQIKTLLDVVNNQLQYAWLRGYVSSANGPYPEFEHFGAFIFLAASFALYLTLQRSFLVAATYLIRVLVVATWALAALSFFLDYFHVPILVPLGLWLLFVSLHPKTDHYYPIVERTPGAEKENSKFTPGQVLKAAMDRKRPIVLVASAGGGIQSAAWTAEVLTQIEKHSLQKCSSDSSSRRFSEAVQLLSGVSGGSVGNMFFASAYETGTIPESLLPSIQEAAFPSSLSQAAKGFAYSDLLRAIFPFLMRRVYSDRGRALERAWMANAGCPLKNHPKVPNALCDTLDKATLQDWQADVVAGHRPAMIFNATTVESGQRLAFSTAPYLPTPPVDADAPSSVIDFTHIYPDSNVLISTAVRLSSTFTYVSPAARPLPANSLANKASPNEDLYVAPKPTNALRLHVVDGGYYESTGLGALVAWLEQAARELDNNGSPMPEQILVITIGAFPPDHNPQYGGKRGAIFQLEAPFLTLESLQGQAHPAGAWRELGLLSESLHRAGTHLFSVEFTFPLSAPPLSWHLRECDKQAITTGWDKIKNKDENLLKIDQFLRGLTPDAGAAKATHLNRVSKDLSGAACL
jgi:hypothetical protein